MKGKLHDYGLHQQDREAFKRFPEVHEHALAVIKPKRDSYPSEDECEQYQASLSTYEGANEDTFLDAILPFLIKRERFVPARKPAMLFSYVEINVFPDIPEPVQSAIDHNELARKADLKDDEKQAIVTFYKSGMMSNSNRDFQQALPFLNDHHYGNTPKMDEELNKYLMKDAKITNPRPDRTYGVRSDQISVLNQIAVPSKIKSVLELIPSCWHIFLVIEGKSTGGDIMEARNQACRAGAIVVNMERQLRALLGMPDKAGADHHTFMFSVALAPNALELNVHWAEVHDNKDPKEEKRRPTYHMNLLRSWTLNDPTGQNLPQMRHALHNIADWGIGERKKKMGSVHKAIADYKET